MIERGSAVTLATYNMPRAVAFYRMLGFELVHGGDDAAFTSFRAGTSFLNLVGRAVDAKKTTRMTRTSNEVQHLGETGGRIMKFLKPCVFLGLLAILAIWISSPRAETLIPDVPHSYPADLLAHIRAAAKAVPGPLPIRINFIKIAESHRPLSDIVVGGSQQDYVSARTAFQVVFPGGWVMIDSGMDETVHKFFGFGRAEPYWADRNALLQQALTAAKLIVVTHEHGDHVAGVIRTDAREEIAAKTLLTRAQVQTLTTYPQMPEIRLTPEMARRYMVVDYEGYLPVAPGIVLIKAPGHTPGHQMVYVRLASEREYLFIGDVGWTLDAVKQLKLRPEATMRRISESAPALMFELTWIKEVMDREGLIVIPSHDDILLKDLTAKQLIGGELAPQ